MESDPEQAIEHDIDELDERVERLEAQIDEARELSSAKEIAGDRDRTEDHAGGEDPVGAHEERDRAHADEVGGSASEDRSPENEG